MLKILKNERRPTEETGGTNIFDSTDPLKTDDINEQIDDSIILYIYLNR